MQHKILPSFQNKSLIVLLVVVVLVLSIKEAKRERVASEGMCTGGWGGILYRWLFSCWTGWPLNTQPFSDHYHNPLNSVGVKWLNHNRILQAQFSVALHCSGPYLTPPDGRENIIIIIIIIRGRPLFQKFNFCFIVWSIFHHVSMRSLLVLWYAFATPVLLYTMEPYFLMFQIKSLSFLLIFQR